MNSNNSKEQSSQSYHGVVTLYDFDTSNFYCHTLTSMAIRIERDLAFDRKMKEIQEQKNLKQGD